MLIVINLMIHHSRIRCNDAGFMLQLFNSLTM